MQHKELQLNNTVTTNEITIQVHATGIRSMVDGEKNAGIDEG